MKARKIPLRSCVVTREKFPKQELLRVVRTPEKTVVIDLTGKANGHGAYVKKDLEVILKAEKSKVLEKHLECQIPDGIYQEMKDIINNK